MNGLALPPGFPPLGQVAGTGSNAALVTFIVYTVAVFVLAVLASRLLQGKAFLSEYFLGSRGLGTWAFALTFAATSSSGGSFTGFPALIYTHGWVLGVWIASYMVVPICTMGLLGKRINQIARKTGAITVPDVLRDRFESPRLGLIATLLIVLLTAVNLVAQFKAGALILRTLLADVPVFARWSLELGQWTEGITWLGDQGPGYLICLGFFAAAVILYTTYGGFHAVVWTDVMQGFVMVGGVLILLPLTIQQAGGLTHATEQLRAMTPPNLGSGRVVAAAPVESDIEIPLGALLSLAPETENAEPGLVRVSRATTIRASEQSSAEVPIVQLTTPEEISRLRGMISQQPEGETLGQLQVQPIELVPYARGAGQAGAYVTGPGPEFREAVGFLPVSMAISFFVMWALSGAGQPSNMVRLMAFDSSRTLRRAIFTVSIYYTIIYLPLVVIFCCARVILPGMELEADRIMPAISVTVTQAAGWPWLGGLLIAAPFAAVMSTVDSFLLLISSVLVRDVYQRNINPDVSERRIRWMSYAITFIVGTGAAIGAINPPQFLQSIIIYTTSGLASGFLVPVTLALYWSRYNRAGAIWGMVSGAGAHLGLYLIGTLLNGGTFTAYRPLGLDPIIWGPIISLVVSVAVTYCTQPPPAYLVQRYFRSAT